LDDGYHSAEERRRKIRTGICQRLSHRQRLETPISFRDLLLGIAAGNIDAARPNLDKRERTAWGGHIRQIRPMVSGVSGTGFFYCPGPSVAKPAGLNMRDGSRCGWMRAINGFATIGGHDDPNPTPHPPRARNPLVDLRSRHQIAWVLNSPDADLPTLPEARAAELSGAGVVAVVWGIGEQEMATPIEKMLDGVEWEEVGRDADRDDGQAIPYMTHKGVLRIGGIDLQCARLSNGKRIFYGDVIDELIACLRDGAAWKLRCTTFRARCGYEPVGFVGRQLDVVGIASCESAQ
jgi:hypothetical protein